MVYWKVPFVKEKTRKEGGEGWLTFRWPCEQDSLIDRILCDVGAQ